MDNKSVIAADGQASTEDRRRMGWTAIALLLAVVFSSVCLWMIRFMDNPPTTAIVAVLGLALAGILLTPVLFQITEFSIGPTGATAKMSERINARINAQQSRIDEQEERLQKQQRHLNDLVKYSMAEYIFEHLQKIYHGQNRDNGWSAEYLYRAKFESQIRFLRDHGYIGFIEIKDLHDEKTNLVDTLVLTPVGRFLVPLREGRS
jgi:hypothetical protein